ncbi:hypothetical protein TNIN_437371 [Trichonephila inaurata madagascariensis]|uniref:Uncharacterized protein n=1 Tax=Trichonephila inaurata madagascariensis TaxID=2747483 RepID=A0A8X6I5B2_9ARAC|nr:hypothetical protein TNIN_437371 [Trichonephila inaurata madagascariensis]
MHFVVKSNDMVIKKFAEKIEPCSLSMWLGTDLNESRAVDTILQSPLNGCKFMENVQVFCCSNRLVSVKKSPMSVLEKTVVKTMPFGGCRKKGTTVSKFSISQCSSSVYSKAIQVKIRFVGESNASNIDFAGFSSIPFTNV